MSINYVNNGSLTTAFTPAPSCFATILHGSQYFLPGAESSPACFPSRMNLFGVRQTAAYFSPGKCPASYTAFTVTTAQIAAPSEYAYNCCPLNLTVDAAADKGCRSYWTESTSFVYSVYDLMVGSIGPAMTTTLTDKFPVSLDAYSIQIRFRDSDISALNLKEPELSALGINVTATATSTAISLTSGSSVTGSSITSSLTSAPTTPLATSSGLSQGARVAIGVVIPTVMISLCVGVSLYFRRRKTKSMISQNLQPRLKSPEYPERAVESGGTARHEAEGRIIHPQWYELDSTQLLEANQSST